MTSMMKRCKNIKLSPPDANHIFLFKGENNDQNIYGIYDHKFSRIHSEENWIRRFMS